MPLYTFICGNCGSSFESIQGSGVSKIMCKFCCSDALKDTKPCRIGIVGKTNASSNNIDKIVGRDAEARWASIYREREERNKARRRYGTDALAKTEDGYVPVGRDHIEHRKDGLRKFDKAFKDKHSK